MGSTTVDTPRKTSGHEAPLKIDAKPTSRLAAHVEQMGNPKVKFKSEDIDFIETARGSTYRYLADGRTQRFKKVESKMHEPHDAIVFIPDYEHLVKIVPKEYMEKGVLGQDEADLEDTILDYTGKYKTVRIIDSDGKILGTNKEMEQTTKQIFLAFITRDMKTAENNVDFYLPVSKIPELGFSPFEMTKSQNEAGEWVRRKHLGNKVVKICLKNGTVIS
jgi:hypothetical protein